MSTEVKDGGALVSAGPAAVPIDSASLHPRGRAETDASCSNCGTRLSGAYCHACGQSGRLHRSLLHLAGEVLHGVLHFDAKGWRTLPLLVARPGLLTRRYIDGQRTRYVSPLALFLFMVFLMFFVFSLTGGSGLSDPARRAAARAQLGKAVDEANAEVTEAAAALAQARRTGGGVAQAERELADAQTGQRATGIALEAFDAMQPTSAGATSPGVEAHAGAQGWREKLAALPVDTGSATLDRMIRQELQNPELFSYKVKNTAYKFSFMLIPISLPFLWLMFVGRPDVALYDHAVFSLYSLSFMSLLFVATVLLKRVGFGGLAAIGFATVAPLHMFLHLRQTYQLGFSGALWRTLALLGVAGTAFLLFLLFIIAVALR